MAIDTENREGFRIYLNSMSWWFGGRKSVKEQKSRMSRVFALKNWLVDSQLFMGRKLEKNTVPLTIDDNQQGRWNLKGKLIKSNLGIFVFHIYFPGYVGVSPITFSSNLMKFQNIYSSVSSTKHNLIPLGIPDNMATRAHMQPICRGCYLPPAAVEFILLKDVAQKQVSFSLGLDFRHAIIG